MAGYPAGWTASTLRPHEPSTYKATLLGDAAVHLRLYSSKHCLGQAHEDQTISLNQCLTSAGQPFMNTFQMVFDPQAPQTVTQKIWIAGGVARCEWHSMYDGAGATAATDVTVLV